MADKKKPRKDHRRLVAITDQKYRLISKVKAVARLASTILSAEVQIVDPAGSVMTLDTIESKLDDIKNELFNRLVSDIVTATNAAVPIYMADKSVPNKYKNIVVITCTNKIDRHYLNPKDIVWASNTITSTSKLKLLKIDKGYSNQYHFGDVSGIDLEQIDSHEGGYTGLAYSLMYNYHQNVIKSLIDKHNFMRDYMNAYSLVNKSTSIGEYVKLMFAQFFPALLKENT